MKFGRTRMKLKAARMTEEEKWLTGFSIALGVGALVAGIVTLVMGRRNSDRPSRNAPQLNVENPGTQAEFPTSATESEVG